MSSINTAWVLIGAAMICFMQAGFTMMESGLTRAKNADRVAIKNVVIYCLGVLSFCVLGFGLMFGGSNAFIGNIDLFIANDYQAIVPSGLPVPAFIIFQAALCGMTVTIAFGAMAGRTKFTTYCIGSMIIAAIVYPVAGHWIWGGGFLQQLGFHDFAGATAVHVVGGICALIGAKILGPRIGKYNSKGESRAIPGHNITLVTLGIFVLWFCWFGVTGCSTLSMEEDVVEKVAKIILNMNLSAAVSASTVMVFTWNRYKKPDTSMVLNGVLAGLVAITAGCDVVSPAGASCIGLLAGIIVVIIIEFVENKLKIDDPVGTIGVHGCCGILGTLLTGIFAAEDGLLYGGNSQLLAAQCAGVLCVILWTCVIMIPTFLIIKHTIGIRISRVEELEIADNLVFEETSVEEKGEVDRNLAIPVLKHEGDFDKRTLTKIEIFTRESKFEELKTALNKIGVTGMNVTRVMGCGVQKGATELYRGVPVEVNLLPKVRVDIVVAKVPVEKVVETARDVLYTGHIGDGKIFVYEVLEAVKIRTGECGVDALQGLHD